MGQAHNQDLVDDPARHCAFKRRRKFLRPRAGRRADSWLGSHAGRLQLPSRLRGLHGRCMVHRRGFGKTRHIDVQYLWIQQHVFEERLHVAKVGTDANPADILTKHLGPRRWPRTSGASASRYKAAEPRAPRGSWQRRQRRAMTSGSPARPQRAGHAGTTSRA